MFIYLAIFIFCSAFFASGYQYYALGTSHKPYWIDRLHNAALFAFAYIVIKIYNPAAFLTIATIILLTVKAYDHFQPKDRKISILTETSRSIWLFLLLFWAFRTFIYDYSPIPSASMEPSLVAGDLIAINKMAYQIKIPPLSKPLYRFAKPKRGEIVVFNSPEIPQQFWIKRVIAIGGDEVEYRNKEFYVNGELYSQSGHNLNYTQNGTYPWLVYAKEHIDDITHRIQLDNRKFNQSIKLVVPEDSIFVSGDNRDYSYDSRVFGPLPLDCVVGQATHIITEINWQTILSFKRTGKIDKNH